MKVDKGMTCCFEENIRRILTDAERKLIVDPKENLMPAKNIQMEEREKECNTDKDNDD